MPTQNTPKVDLNSRESIARFDKDNMLGSIESLGLQVKHAWDDVGKLDFHLKTPPKNIVVAGMGGSGLGADVIKQLFKDQFQVPFDLVNSYTLPNYVDSNSLVILSSYSGNTEEILNAGKDALKRKAQVMVITSGGKLYQMAQKYHWPTYKIDPKFNPSGQPRMAIGYSVFGTLAMCHQAGVIKLDHDQVEAVAKTIADTVAQNTVEISTENNPAKSLAFMMLDRKTVYVGAEFLVGALHVAANQANENAKTFTDYKAIPEMDHHLLEALKYPTNLNSTHLFIFMQSPLYLERNQKRIELTQQIVEDYGIENIKVDLTAPTKIQQVWESITILGFAAFYLAMLEGINPSPIPYVEKFKQQL